MKSELKLNLSYLSSNKERSSIIVDSMFNRFSSELNKIGPAFVLTIFVFIFFVTSSYFKLILPYYVNKTGITFSFLITLLAVFILFNLIFNFIMAVIVKPGSLSELRNSNFYKKNKNLLFNDEILNMLKIQRERLSGNNLEELNTFSYSDCKFCEDTKLARSHHCKVCKICVLKMDHHCPWINNCVGLNNQRYFILFLTWLLMGCIFIVLFGFVPFFFSNKYFSKQLMFIMIFCSVGSIMTLFFNIWNWYIVYKGLTSIEFWSGYENEFELKDWKDNIYLVFGTRSLFSAIFCISYKRIKYSGAEWSKLIDETLSEDQIFRNDKLDNKLIYKAV